MVEKIIQRDEEVTEGENRLFKLPKHIRQMGRGGNQPEIYIEDYAEGFLRRLAGSDYTECRAAVLVGEFVKAEGKRYVFIRGAIEAEGVMEDNVPKFTSESWAGVYEKIKRYFPQYEAVGWFLGGPEFLTEINETIEQVHVDWFGGRDRVLYRVDPVEKEATFYLYDKGALQEWPGYCIYYEKNEEMQDYMVAGKKASVDAGYKEPVLAELGRRVGRKEEPEENAAEEETIAVEEPAKEETEEKMEVSEAVTKGAETKPSGKGGNRHSGGWVAAAALFAIGAFALREQDILSPAVDGTPTPAITAQAQAGDSSQLLEVDAKGAVTSTPAPTEQASGLLPGEFVPADPESEQKEQNPEPEATSVETTVQELLPGFVPEELEELPDYEAMELYVVQNGDTLAAICRNYYGDISRMEEVKGVNQIPDENWIYAGQELYLP